MLEEKINGLKIFEKLKLMLEEKKVLKLINDKKKINVLRKK